MDLRLNLGCGRDPKKGWVNVDVREGEGVDRIIDLDRAGCLSPWTTASVDEIIAFGLLEHLPHYENLVDEAVRVLKPGAPLRIRVPYKTDYVMYHVRHFDKNTFNPFRSDHNPMDLDFVRRPHRYGSLEFREPYLVLESRWVEHWVPFSWHVHKYLGVDIARFPLGKRLNLHFVFRRNGTPWKPSTSRS